MIPQLIEKSILSKTLDSVITSNERVLVAFFQKRKNQFPESTIDFYKNHISQSNWSALFSDYPVAINMVVYEEAKKRRLIETIISRFSRDYDELRTNGIIQDSNLYIKNIEIGAGDLHRGMSTAIVELSNNQKIIFKPTGATVSEALFSFLD
jgi:lantibiotic modifying enzyme